MDTKEKLLSSPDNWTREVVEAFYSRFPFTPFDNVVVEWITKGDLDGDGGIIVTLAHNSMVVPVIIRELRLKPMDIAILPDGSMDTLDKSFIDLMAMRAPGGRPISKEQESQVRKSSGQRGLPKMASLNRNPEELKEVLTKLSSSEYQLKLKYNPILKTAVDHYIGLVKTAIHQGDFEQQLHKLDTITQITKTGSRVSLWDSSGEEVESLPMEDIRGPLRAMQGIFEKTAEDHWARKMTQYAIVDEVLTPLQVSHGWLTKFASEEVKTSRVTITKTSNLNENSVISMPKGTLTVDTLSKTAGIISGKGLYNNSDTGELRYLYFKENPLVKQAAFIEEDQVLLPGQISVLEPIRGSIPEWHMRNGDYEHHNITKIASKWSLDTNDPVSYQELDNQLVKIGIDASLVTPYLDTHSELTILVKRASYSMENDTITLPRLPTSILLKIAETASAQGSAGANTNDISMMLAPMAQESVSIKDIKKVLPSLEEFRQIMLQIQLAAKKGDIYLEEDIIKEVVGPTSIFLRSLNVQLQKDSNQVPVKKKLES